MWALSIRTLVAVAVAVAGVLPILMQMVFSGLMPAWTSIILAAAAALLGLDRYFGFSSGWTRYMVTELKLFRILQEFQFDWEALRAGPSSTTSGHDIAQKLIARAKACVMELKRAVESETSTWVVDFRQSLTQLELALAKQGGKSADGKDG